MLGFRVLGFFVFFRLGFGIWGLGSWLFSQSPRPDMNQGGGGLDTESAKLPSYVGSRT